jgi:hypothetical protein
VSQHVDRERHEGEGQRDARHYGRQQELDREEHEHDRRVRAAQPQRDERRDREQRHGDRQEQLDPLASGERQRPHPGAERVGDRQRAEGERVLAHGAGEQHGDALASATVREQHERYDELRHLGRDGHHPLQQQVGTDAHELAAAQHRVAERDRG